MPAPSRNTFTCQRGQASVIVVVFLGVVVLSAIFLYQSGRLTTEKMQLQNAADAAAFGTSTLEARFMNYCAYTNRAMVANEVAVGQFIGILSLTDQAVSQGEYLQFYGELLQPIGEALESIPCPIPVPEIIGAVINAIAELMQSGGEALGGVFKTIEFGVKATDQVAVPVMSMVNWFYGASQETVRWATMFAGAYNIYRTISDNSPGTKYSDPLDVLTKGASAQGVQVSPVGLMAIGGHYMEFMGVLDLIPKFNFENLKDKLDEKLFHTFDKYIKKIFDLDVDVKKIKEIFGIEGSLFEKVGELDKHQYTPYIRRYWGLPEFGEKKKDDEEQDSDIEMDEYDADGNVIRAASTADSGEKKEKGGSWKDFIKFNKNKEIREKGMRRFAASVREARDPFTSGSKDPVTIHTKWGDIDYEGRGFNLTFGIKSNDSWFGDFFSLDTKQGFVASGGSELYAKNGNFAWTAMDVTNLKSVTHLQLKGILKEGADWVKKLSALTGCTIDFQKMIDSFLHTIEMAQLPAGNGFAEAGLSSGGTFKGTMATEKDMKIMALWVLLNGLRHMDKPSPAPDGYYGGALSPMNWSAFIPDIPGIELPVEPPGIFHRMKEKELNEVDLYFGLPPYSDIALGNRPSDDPDDPPKLGFRMPFFIIGLTRSMEDTLAGGPQFKGRFDLTHDEDGNPVNTSMGVVAKSQVYFSRPEDLSYFVRKDKYTEKANMFSPFWQARLVKTTDLDRLIFLAMQDNVLWLPQL